MIVITGSGRSGTSMMADLYKKLGFDPGGGWDKKIRAGREAPEIVEINNQLNIDLQAPIKAQQSTSVGQQRWDLVPALAEKYGPRLRELSNKFEVVKDPRFSWTLRVWFEAQANIDHVIVMMRRVDDVMKSARYAGMARQEPSDEQRNLPKAVLMYRIGSMLTAIGDYKIPSTTIWFPECLSDPEQLHQDLVFPKPVRLGKFLRVFRKVVDDDKVHFGTPAPSTGSREA
jgi:hypothetical protein